MQPRETHPHHARHLGQVTNQMAGQRNARQARISPQRPKDNSVCDGKRCKSKCAFQLGGEKAPCSKLGHFQRELVQQLNAQEFGQNVNKK